MHGLEHARALVGDVRRAGTLRAADGGRPAVGAGNEQVLRTGSLERRHRHGVRSAVPSDRVAARGRLARMRNLDRQHRDPRPRGDHVQPPGMPVALDPVPAPRLPLLEQDEPLPGRGARIAQLLHVVLERLQEACGVGELTSRGVLETTLEPRALGRSRKDVPLAARRRLDEVADLVDESRSGPAVAPVAAAGAGERVSSLWQSTADGTLAPSRDAAGPTAEAAPATTTSTANAEPARENIPVTCGSYRAPVDVSLARRPRSRDRSSFSPHAARGKANHAPPRASSPASGRVRL